MPMSKVDFDAWTVRVDDAYDDLESAVADRDDKAADSQTAAEVLAAAVAEVEAKARALDLLAIEYKASVRDQYDVVPYVVYCGPASGATDVEIDAPITVTFSKEMSTATLTDDNIYLLDEADDPASPAQTGNPTVSQDKKSVTLTLSTTLTKSAQYKIHVTTGVTDSDGNALASAYEQAETWTVVS